MLQTCITQERLRWKKEEELERSRALEAAVAIAEVKWLDEEQKKITEAVEQALLTTRETWQGEKQRDLGTFNTGSQQQLHLFLSIKIC